MKKTIAKKVLYIIVALAMLVMMIPASTVPAGAASGNAVQLRLVDPLTHSLVAEQSSTLGYNVAYSIVQIDATKGSGFTVSSWSEPFASTDAGWVGPDPNSVADCTTARAQGKSADVSFAVTFDNGTQETLNVEKKWGYMTRTAIDNGAGAQALDWDKDNQEYNNTVISGKLVDITDTAYGAFYVSGNPNTEEPAQGVILNWYLLRADANYAAITGEAVALKSAIASLQSSYAPIYTTFVGGISPDKITQETVTGTTGMSTVQLECHGTEAVQIVVVPEYPNTRPAGVNDPVTTEVTTFDFYSPIPCEVPQVRWAGEKIVLESNFDPSYEGYTVKFNLESGTIGTLYSIDNLTADATSVETTVDSNGLASVELKSSDAGISYVDVALYDDAEGIWIQNQAHFTVYWLKFESLTLGDVKGKRAGHYEGLWVMNDGGTNPWDPTGDYNGTGNSYGGSGSYDLADCTTQTLNVSQDALLRAVVRGYFPGTASEHTNRPEAPIFPGALIQKPYGRFVLPDDWDDLAGAQSSSLRKYWNIMCDPFGAVTSTSTTGAYYETIKGVDTQVSSSPIIGPFSPGLEVMGAEGWVVNPTPPSPDPERPIRTVVPDYVASSGAANITIWDAPMPAAKITFQIQTNGAMNYNGSPMDEAGFFKPTDKAQVYYIDNPSQAQGPSVLYTNPFYEIYVAAHEAIPVISDGYEWNTFGDDDEYFFWDFIARDVNNPVATTDPNYPTEVTVFSDNHGEAMTWLNGDWNLELTKWTCGENAADIPWGDTVGATTVLAFADYPYQAGDHPVMESNTDTKTWTWGGLVLGPGVEDHQYGNSELGISGAVSYMVLATGNYDNSTKQGVYPNESAASLYKMVWVWVTDRDGLATGVNGAKVRWTISNTGTSLGATISGYNRTGISQYNEVTRDIDLQKGFLAGTNGTITDAYNEIGVSYLKTPSDAEKVLFDKFYSSLNLDADNFCVAAIELYANGGLGTSASVKIEITSPDFILLNPDEQETGTLVYATNVGFSYLDNLDDGLLVGDANCDGAVNMADVTAVERMILGYSTVTSNVGCTNADGSVDMGTVVKIERTILGY